VPSGATVILNVNTNRVDSLTINAGGTLRGDNTNKILTMNGNNAPDLTNNGTLDFGAGNLATLFARRDIEVSGAGTWNLSVIDLNSNVLTFAGGSSMTINMSGAALPIINPGTLTSLAAVTWNFTGTVAQTLPNSANVTYGNMTISNTTGVTLGIALTATRILGNLTVAANGILNNGGLAITLAAARNFAVQANGRFNLTGTSTMVAVSGGGTKTFNATSTVNYGGANQAATAETYGNLIMSGTGTKTPAAGTTTIAGNFTLGAGVTYAGTTNNPVVNLAGDFSNSGTFNSGTGVFSFNGTAAQTLTGATTFTNLTMNNNAAFANRKLTINNDITVSTLLTFNAAANTGGRIVTAGAAKVIIPSTGNITNASGSATESDFIAGRLQRFVAAGGSTVAFPVGTDGAALPGAGYTPTSLTFAGVAVGGGSLIVSVGTPLGDHPNIGTSGLDLAKSVNRWWALTTTGVTGTALPAFTSYSATFTFIPGVTPAGDLDSGTNTANFEIERRSGAAWNTTTVGTRTGTTTQATGITALGEFAIAEKTVVVSTPGDFNAFETSTGGGSITGRIYTKLVGVNFSLDVVAILGGAQFAAFTNTVQVDLVTGSTGGLGCPGTPVAIAGTSQNVNLTTGRGTTGAFNVASAYPNVRVRMRYPVASPTVTSCSTDNFAIRPAAFGIPTSNMTNAASTGAPVAKAGDAFTITVVASAGYDGTPSFDSSLLTAHAGAVQVGSVGGSFSAANPASGTATGATFTYSEVGNFAIGANGVFDGSFTSVDQAAGDCTNDFSNSLVGGRYGCKIGNSSASSAIGRFTPDHFDVSLNTPTFATGCGPGNYTYVGQTFNYTVQPVITVTAKNAAGIGNTTTQNYTGASWFKLTNGSLTGKAYTAATGTLDASGVAGTDPVVADTGAGTASITFSSGTGLFFARSIPVAPFNSEISLAINVIDGDTPAIVYALNPARFAAATSGNGIAFNNGKSMRFGQLAIRNANGSQLVPLPVRVEAQYWSGAPTNAFITNTADSCTTIATNNVAMSSFTNNLAACETAITAVGAFSGGRSTLTLAAPGAGNDGSVDLAVNLSAVSSGTTCTTVGAGTVPAAGANRTYLQGNWTGGAYNQNPSARVTFGIFRGSEEVIFIRENFQ
jgi:MSHA biogenesis protein MshQ